MVVVVPSYVHATWVHAVVVMPASTCAEMPLTIVHASLPVSCRKKPYCPFMSRMPMRLPDAGSIDGLIHASIVIAVISQSALSATSAALLDANCIALPTLPPLGNVTFIVVASRLCADPSFPLLSN